MSVSMMTLKEQLIHVANLYAKETDTRGRNGEISLAGISTKIFNDGKTLARVLAGGDVTTGSFERAIRWFSENWPADVEWPPTVLRPERASGQAA